MQFSKWSIITSLVLLMAIPVRGEGLSHKKQKEPIVDSLAIYVERGDSCMLDYNTFEALEHYQKAFALCDTTMTRTKLADCYYKRANYREAADLLKLMSEDSLSHESFRQLAYSYQKQGDVDSFIYWAELLVNRFPKDGEVVAALINALSQKNQPHKGLKYGSVYSLHDMHNILVNRAMADAFFLDRNFTAAAVWYQHLIEQGDSTFNTLYSAGMCYSQIEDLERAYTHLRAALFLSQMRHYGCAYRLGVVCIDTKRYEEGLGYLALATELMRPDTTAMKAITLSQGEGYYLTGQYDKAVNIWKQHLAYNPGSIATYYNIANTYALILKDDELAKTYYRQFLNLVRQETNPNASLTEMINKAEAMLKYYEMSE